MEKHNDVYMEFVRVDRTVVMKFLSTYRSIKVEYIIPKMKTATWKMKGIFMILMKISMIKTKKNQLGRKR